MKLGIIITNDWELYGNGKGDYYLLQEKPLKDILDVLDGYGARLTLFAEVMQQLYMSYEGAYSRDVFNNWEKTIQHVLSTGHDVQLHIHPQLIKGRDNSPVWSIAELREEEMYRLILEGKDYLEKVLLPVDKNYRCIAFRAGGYAIQPSQTVIKNLVKAGIKCDSSVTKGMTGSYYNFKNAYSRFFPWFAKNDICLQEKRSTKDSILEVPVFSVPGIDSPLLRNISPFFYYLIFFSTRLSLPELRWLKEKKKDNYSFREKYSMQLKKSPIKFIGNKLFHYSSVQMDYDKIPARIIVQNIMQLYERLNVLEITGFEKCYIPVVLIGHTKNLKNTYNLENLLYLLQGTLQNNYQYLTLGDFLGHFDKNNENYKELSKVLNRKDVI